MDMEDNMQAIMQETEALLENNEQLSAINAELTDALNRIAARQARERVENTVWYALMVDGEIWKEDTDFNAVREAAAYIDGAEIYTWTTTPKKPLTLAEEEKVEGN